MPLSVVGGTVRLPLVALPPPRPSLQTRDGAQRGRRGRESTLCARGCGQRPSLPGTTSPSRCAARS